MRCSTAPWRSSACRWPCSRPATPAAAEAAARLLAEARALARLVHPHIVAVHDAFEDGGRLHVVMERVDGPTLRQALDARGPLALDQLGRLASHLAAALAHAHGRGVVHRDVKPENVLLAPADSADPGGGGPGWTAKLADFGLAYSPSRARLTQPGIAVGTPAYVAPEQAAGQAVDARADLYALGCLLYEAATGAPPFAGDDPLAVVHQHLHAAPAPPSSRRPDLPPAWDALLLRLLAKRREDRPPSAAALLADLPAPAAAGAPPAGRGPRHNLPRPLTSFVGRERELAEVKGLLAQEPPGAPCSPWWASAAPARPGWRCASRPTCSASTRTASGWWSWPRSPIPRWCPRRWPPSWGSGRSPAAPCWRR